VFKKKLDCFFSVSQKITLFFSFFSFSLRNIKNKKKLSCLLNIRRRAIQQQPQARNIGLVVLLDDQKVQPPGGVLGELPGRGLLRGGRPGRDGPVAPPLADSRVQHQAAPLRVGGEGGDLVARRPGGEGQGAPRVDGDTFFLVVVEEFEKKVSFSSFFFFLPSLPSFFPLQLSFSLSHLESECQQPETTCFCPDRHQKQPRTHRLYELRPAPERAPPRVTARKPTPLPSKHREAAPGRHRRRHLHQRRCPAPQTEAEPLPRTQASEGKPLRLSSRARRREQSTSSRGRA